ASNLANDLVLSRELDAARNLSARTLEISRHVRGEEHPYTLLCAVNAALDLQATGDEAAGQSLLGHTLEVLGRWLGPEHPETLDAGRYRRAECAIDPPSSTLVRSP